MENNKKNEVKRLRSPIINVSACDYQLKESFVENFYKSLFDNKQLLSERVNRIMPVLIEENWLVSYKTIDGIKHILTQMDRRTKNQSKMQFATQELLEFYSEFENEFTKFFEELITYSNTKMITL